ncbi:MAG: hypothetical protein M1816_007323 [Peltula sp. TS41687]|nr:MAG: hypothetical protein M1816_007323 [Peltula sp. TS41687]
MAPLVNKWLPRVDYIPGRDALLTDDVPIHKKRQYVKAIVQAVQQWDRFIEALERPSIEATTSMDTKVLLSSLHAHMLDCEQILNQLNQQSPTLVSEKQRASVKSFKEQIEGHLGLLSAVPPSQIPSGSPHSLFLAALAMQLQGESQLRGSDLMGK